MTDHDADELDREEAEAILDEAPEPRQRIPATRAALGAAQALVALRERGQERAHTITGLRAQLDAAMGAAAVLTHPDTGAAVAWRHGTRIVVAPTIERTAPHESH